MPLFNCGKYGDLHNVQNQTYKDVNEESQILKHKAIKMPNQSYNKYRFPRAQKLPEKTDGALNFGILAPARK